MLALHHIFKTDHSWKDYTYNFIQNYSMFMFYGTCVYIDKRIIYLSCYKKGISVI